ncbi:hypothetical protein UFOVP313_35 [uncultured Caudovirales phage]|uniref:Uncharacterized protein n=1 Tax=uncultured Caudovirales phage TaxID=2100421 RepID=A0A6J5LVL8_9CAUD|nr:hypothetical protein UFOVP313_35 [uncultured Caudovirales phage]
MTLEAGVPLLPPDGGGVAPRPEGPAPEVTHLPFTSVLVDPSAFLLRPSAIISSLPGHVSREKH